MSAVTRRDVRTGDGAGRGGRVCRREGPWTQDRSKLDNSSHLELKSKLVVKQKIKKNGQASSSDKGKGRVEGGA